MPYELVLGASPKIADIAVASTDSHAYPGQLNSFVLSELGYGAEGDIETVRDISPLESNSTN